MAEGLPGTHTPVNEMLDAAGAFSGTKTTEVMRDHELLNVDLDHTTMARRLLSHVPAVTVGAQHTALRHMMLLLELNFRAWDDLCWYYTHRPAGWLHGAFALSPAEVISWPSIRPRLTDIEGNSTHPARPTPPRHCAAVIVGAVRA